MRLNHLDLTVPNVAQSRAFFEKYFGLRCIVAVSRGDDDVAVLTDEQGFALTLNNLDKRPVEYPGGFHVGFMQDSRERVNEIHERLKSDDFEVESPRKYHGAWTFFFRAGWLRHRSLASIPARGRTGRGSHEAGVGQDGRATGCE